MLQFLIEIVEIQSSIKRPLLVVCCVFEVLILMLSAPSQVGLLFYPCYYYHQYFA